MERYTDLGFPQEDAFMLNDAENAVKLADLWTWLKTANLTNLWEPEFNKISDQMKYKGHSGASFMWAVFNMKSIANMGWEAWANNAREKHQTFRKA